MARNASQPFQSKPGRHGTLYRFRVTYRNDPPMRGDPDLTLMTWNYDADAVIDDFQEYGGDEEGWKIVKVEKVRESGGAKVQQNFSGLRSFSWR